MRKYGCARVVCAVAFLLFGALKANADEEVIVIENMPDNCQRENHGAITCDGYTVDEFCRLFGSSYEDFCYGGSSGSGSGSGETDDEDEFTDTDEALAECDALGGTWRDAAGGGWCDFPMDEEAKATCICYLPNHTESVTPNVTWPACQSREALETDLWSFPVSCSWN